MDGIYLFIIVGFLILVQLTIGAKAKRREMLDRVVPRAVEIAKLQGWVSSRRLMTQENLKRRCARHALADACRRGLLYRAPNGRYYVKQIRADSKAYHEVIAKAA